MLNVYYLNDFHKPRLDVEPGIDEICIILSLGHIFISLGLKMTYLARREHRFNGECIC